MSLVSELKITEFPIDPACSVSQVYVVTCDEWKYVVLKHWLDVGTDVIIQFDSLGETANGVKKSLLDSPIWVGS